MKIRLEVNERVAWANICILIRRNCANSSTLLSTLTPVPRRLEMTLVAVICNDKTYLLFLIRTLKAFCCIHVSSLLLLPLPSRTGSTPLLTVFKHLCSFVLDEGMLDHGLRCDETYREPQSLHAVRLQESYNNSSW